MINKFDSGEAKNNLSSHSGNLVGDLLDLEVGEYNPEENNVTTNSDASSFDKRVGKSVYLHLGKKTTRD